MKQSARKFAFFFVPLCAGISLLALFAARTDTGGPPALPPPLLSTRPVQWLPLIPPSTAPADSPSVTLAADPYQHPSGAFALRYPDSWQIDEAEDSVQFTAPDDSGQLSVTFAAASPAPDPGQVYERDLRQTWGDLPAFSLESLDPSGLPSRWAATFRFDRPVLPYQSTTQTLGLSVYLPRHNVLYTFTTLVQADSRDTLLPVLRPLADTLQTDPAAALANSE